MTDKLVEFANALDIDPALQSSYKENPKQTMKEFGVTLEDINLILSNDLAAIENRLKMSGMKAFIIISKSK